MRRGGGWVTGATTCDEVRFTGNCRVLGSQMWERAAWGWGRFGGVHVLAEALEEDREDSLVMTPCY